MRQKFRENSSFLETSPGKKYTRRKGGDTLENFTREERDSEAIFHANFSFLQLTIFFAKVTFLYNSSKVHDFEA